jgi:hypothetical protein
MHRVVVETRVKSYYNMVDGESVESKGTEIVREIAVSQAGLKLLKATRPDLFERDELPPTERVWRKKPIADLDEEIDWREWGV